MKKIDKLIRFKLAQKAKGAKLEPSPACPSDLELTNYASGVLDGTKKEIIEKHISECFLCLDKLVSSYEVGKLLTKRKIKEPPGDVTWKAKNIDRISDELPPRPPLAGRADLPTAEIKDRIDVALSRKSLLSKTQKLLTTEKAVIKWLPKNLKKNRWLIASIAAFVLSFAFPLVFLQFLLAAGILGGKWIFDSENAKTLIMIYNAWKKGGEKEAGEMIEILKDRLPNKR